MSYGIIVAPDAFDDLKTGTLPQEIVPQIYEALAELAEDPVSRGQKAVIPYEVPLQVFYFKCRARGTTYDLAAQFKYSEDEQRIEIVKVRHRRYLL